MFLRVNVLTQALVRSSAAIVALATLGAQAQTVAPVLVPYNITAIAGNNQSSIAGYGGEGVAGLSATLSGPNAMAVDSVGNVYIADQSNAIIREWNPRTNLIQTIAGVPPTSCTGTTCTKINSGCVDGAPAATSPVGSRMQGLVVDGYGNVYYSDYNYQGVWVIYRGGAKLAAFINSVDSSGVTNAGGVIPGYIYHIAGVAVPKTGGCSATSGALDGPALSAKFHDPLQMGIDASGNLYIQDYANNVVRVLNTQSTPQSFLGITVQPGYVQSIVGCNATLTVACPASVPPFGSPATGALFNTLSGMTTDQYGNVYQVNTKGATGSIYGGVAYAGGSGLAHLLNLESGLTPTVGGWYEVINSITSSYCTGYAVGGCTTSAPLEPAIQANGANNIALRPDAIAVDPLGNVWMNDTHWLDFYRVDVNSQMATRIMPGSGNSSQVAPAGTNAAPVACPTTNAGTPNTSGAVTTDAYGDGCPVQEAKMSSGGVGYLAFDAAGNLYFADSGDNIVRKVSLGTQFPATNVGATATQTAQIHFDPSNLPTANNATAFNILGSGSEFAVSNVNCANYTIRDTSIECYVTVTFTPKGVGTRAATLQATTAAGTYSFGLNGLGAGPVLAIDGGAQTPVSITGLGNATTVAFDPQGNLYTADPTNNRIVMTPAGGGTPTAVGTGFSAPYGVAVDASSNVYVSDTGNNRIVEIAAGTHQQTVLTTNVSSPSGIAVDAMGNVYVADTGNKRIVEISPWGALGTVPLLSYPSAPALSSPVGIALDTAGNIYVADAANSNSVYKIAAGGGDLQIPAGATSLPSPVTAISFRSATVSKPTGIAVDAAGNIYVSDNSGGSVVVLPSGSGPLSTPYTLGFNGLVNPAGLALDGSGNVYVADSGNKRVVVENRSAASVNFGTVPLFSPAVNATLNVLNIGTAALTPAAPFATVSGATADYSETDLCAASNFPVGTLGTGLHCTLTASFQPTANGPRSGAISVQGGSASVSLTGTGLAPAASLSMSITSPASGPAYGMPATVTLVATQPNGTHAVPTGTVTFNYTINGVAQTASTSNLTVSGNQSTATLVLPNLQPARVYSITATYNGDSNTSVTVSSPFTFTAPGVSTLTVVANPVSYTYGGTVPALTGTVTGILPADQAGITISFTSAATSSSRVGTYPIVAVLSGGNSANYVVPPAVTSTGAPAVVTENQAPLTITVPTFTIYYGQRDISYDSNVGDNGSVTTVTGLTGGDTRIAYSWTPVSSSLVPAGTYSIVPTPSIPSTYDRIVNYKVTINPGTLIVTKAASTTTATIFQSSAQAIILPSALSTAVVSMTVTPPNAGVATGTVTLTDTFTPLTNSGPGTSVTGTPVTFTIVPGKASLYTPTDPTLGTHVYSIVYSGDSNLNGSSTTQTLVVDNPDFTVASTTSPITLVPGTVPGGDPTQPNEQAAYPEQALVYIAPVLGSTSTVNLTCAVPASYITCTLSPTSVTLAGKTLTSTVSVSVPATLPINFTGSVRGPASNFVVAFVPAGLLVLLPLMRRRRKVSQLLLAAAAFAILATAGGCGGGNLVKFFTPVPAGPSSVVVTGTNGTQTRSFTIPINIQ